MKEIIEQVQAWAQAHEQEMTEELARWVQIPSVRDDATATSDSPFGKACGDMLVYVQKRTAEMGFQWINHEGYCLTIYDRSIQDNDFGIISHLDVVPASDDWSFPPFCGRIREGFVYGRGAHDNKSAAVMSLYLLRALRELKVPLKRNLRLIMGVAEETGMQDMDHYLKKNTPPAVSLVPDCLYPANFAQKGHLKGRVSMEIGEDILAFEAGISENAVPASAKMLVKIPVEKIRAALSDVPDAWITSCGDASMIEMEGVSTHASNPEKGISAIYRLCSVMANAKILSACSQRAIEVLLQLASDYYGGAANLDCQDTYGGKTTLVVGTAKAENGRLSWTLDGRICLGMPVDTAEGLTRKFCENNHVRIEHLSLDPSLYFDPQGILIQTLQQSWHNLTGREDLPYYTGGGTYSRVVPNAITYGIIGGGWGKREETIAAGRGSAHEKDEYIHASVMIHGLVAYAAALCSLDQVCS